MYINVFDFYQQKFNIVIKISFWSLFTLNLISSLIFLKLYMTGLF